MGLLLKAIWIIISIKFCCGHGDIFEKSSLTFVIDDTGSMGDDIKAVIEGANAIFDVVTDSNGSQIANFVLVTFNDPAVHVRIKSTTDPVKFKSTLTNISVYGGGDCPEMSMAGIKKALEISLSGSYLYVFTDASAKDYSLSDSVISLSQQKECQVVFVLTGLCDSKSAPNYLVYGAIAAATGGDVFHLKKDDINKILKYVENTVGGRRPPILEKTLPAGRNNVAIPVDKSTADVTISNVGKDSTIEVFNPKGKKLKTVEVTSTDEIKIVKPEIRDTGIHEAKIGSSSGSVLKVTAKSDFQIRTGFSPFKPKTIDDTSRQPLPDKETYLSIASSNPSIELLTAEILNVYDTTDVKITYPLKKINDNLYVTNPFISPKDNFKIAVNGYDPASNETIRRISPIPVRPQKPELEEAIDKKPTVSIREGSTVNIDYNAAAVLTCHVYAYPKPDITWVDETDREIPANMSVIEFPYKYVSILKIEAATEDTNFYCKANNPLGNDSKHIQVKIKTYFVVKEHPKDKTVEFNKESSFKCEIDANPKATVQWYHNKTLIESNKDFDISHDNSRLTIKHMKPSLVGSLVCKARNEKESHSFEAKLDISGFDPPKLEKSIAQINVLINSRLTINCKVLKGTPEVSINWKFKAFGEKYFSNLKSTEPVIAYENVKKINGGTYICEANNIAGKDTYTVNANVEYPPAIEEGYAKQINVNEGEPVTITCRSDGYPEPTVQWLCHGRNIPPRLTKFRQYADKSISFSAGEVDSGEYKCVATNKHGSAEKAVMVNVITPPKIEIPETTTSSIMEGSSVTLPCKAHGNPKPTTEWTHSRNISRKLIKPDSRVDYFTITDAVVTKGGYYTCTATNVANTTSITYHVNVFAPAKILDNSRIRKYSAVVGDVALNIACQATGNPSPEIVWTMNGLNLPSDTEWYNIDKRGTLTIKNIDNEAKGVYTCKASNAYGLDSFSTEVVVQESPEVTGPIRSIHAGIGTNAKLICDLKHQLTDKLTWYKDGRRFNVGQLTLSNVDKTDQGRYTCRVSNTLSSHSSSIDLKIGSPPKFYSSKFTDSYDFIEGNVANFDCFVEDETSVNIFWTLDGRKIEEVDTFDYFIELTSEENVGRYTCVASNEYGTITRDFEVQRRECIIDMNKLIIEPLLLTKSSSWLDPETNDGKVKIPSGHRFKVACPSADPSNKNYLIQFPEYSEITVTCEHGSYFKIDDEVFLFEDIECSQAVEPSYRYGPCEVPYVNTERVAVGFDVKPFLEVYSICFNRSSNNPLYSEVTIPYNVEDNTPVDGKWRRTPLFGNIAPNEVYDCELQINTTSNRLRRWFHKFDGCCFDRGVLVNALDVRHGPSQVATYDYVNTAPQWSTCNGKTNWKEVERRIRSLSRDMAQDLKVWSGTSHSLALPNYNHTNINIALMDKKNKEIGVPLYFWKVVQDPTTKKSVVIIYVNVPDLTTSEAMRYLLCEDQCSKIDWMRKDNWNDMHLGFVYCCNIREFQRKFGYTNEMFKSSGELLTGHESGIIHT